MELLNSENLESEKHNQVLDDVTKSTLTSLDIKEEKNDLKPTIKGNAILDYKVTQLKLYFLKLLWQIKICK